MARRLTIDFVREEFNKADFELISDIYINAHEKLVYRCKKHPEYIQTITWNDFKQGCRCTYCINKRVISIELVKKEFDDAGLILLSKEYVNAKTYLEYLCPIHSNEVQQITYNSFQQGHGCKYCGYDKASINSRLDFNNISEKFNECNYTLITTKDEYVDTHSLLKYVCPHHPDTIQEISAKSFLYNNARCKLCAIERNSDLMRFDFSFVKTLFTDKNYLLLDNDYINSHTLMRYVCLHHPDKVQTISVNSLRQGQGCKYCAKEYLAKALRLDFEFVKEQYNKADFELIEEEYKNVETPMKCICRKHPDCIQHIPYVRIQQGQYGCKYCKQEKISESLRLDINFVKQQFINSGRTPLFDEYKNNRELLPYECIEHPGKINYISYDRLSKVSQCCSEGREYSGEKRIRKFMESKGVEFMPQKIFEGCVFKHLLKFDFYLSNYNVVVEYQGQGHYYPVCFGGISIERANKNFEEQLIRDEIKREYCKNNNIDLLEIPYFLFDEIEDILDNYLQGLEEIRREMVNIGE